MTAFGFNMRVDIIRITESTDSYGGSVETGTVLYSNEFSRLDEYNVRQSTIGREGMETRRSFNFYLRSAAQQQRVIKENDVVKIMFPLNHPNINRRFRIRSVNTESHHPSSNLGIVELSTDRIEESRGLDQ